MKATTQHRLVRGAIAGLVVIGMFGSAGAADARPLAAVRFPVSVLKNHGGLGIRAGALPVKVPVKVTKPVPKPAKPSTPVAAPPATPTTTPAPTASPAPTPVSTTSPATGSSGEAMPTGNLPGWKQTLATDFTTDVAQGGFPGPYASSWMSYNGFGDTSGVGQYDQSIISVNQSVLSLNIHTNASGKPLGAAPIPLVGGHWGGQTYGRFSVRMRADSMADYGAAFLLWSDANNWNDGEIDFPEGNFDGTAFAHNHCIGAPQNNCLAVDTHTAFTAWHTYTINWTPSLLSYEIDGKVVAQTTSNIPSKPLHWVMQVGTNGTKPSASTSGQMQIDWATVYSYAP